MTTAQPQPSNTFLALLSTVIPMIAGYSYFAGWMYLYFFYDAFGVSLLTLDFPFHFYLIYSFTILPPLYYLIIFSVVLFVFFIVFKVLHVAQKLASSAIGLFFTRNELHLNAYSRWFISILLVTIFAGVAELMRSIALARADEVRKGEVLKYVKLTFKKDATVSYPEKLISAAKDGALMKLVQTKDRIFVILQPGQNDKLLGSASSYSVALSDLALVDVKLDMPLKNTP